MIRLSKPPQLKPMRNSRMPSSMAATPSRDAGFSTTERRPFAPEKSRRQMSWPGHDAQGRIKDPRHLPAPLEPLGDDQRGSLMVGEADGERSEPAQRQLAVVGRGGAAEHGRGATDSAASRAGWW